MGNSRREDEKRRREAAQAGVATVEDGGYEVAGRSIKQMVSVRLEAQLLKQLRQLAEQQDMSISDLLRQAAVELVEHRHAKSVLLTIRPAGSQQVISSALTAEQVTSGVPNRATQISISGSSGSVGLLTR
jgi:predicted DNA-binding ribbon-helix-helix protein